MKNNMKFTFFLKYSIFLNYKKLKKKVGKVLAFYFIFEVNTCDTASWFVHLIGRTAHVSSLHRLLLDISPQFSTIKRAHIIDLVSQIHYTSMHQVGIHCPPTHTNIISHRANSIHPSRRPIHLLTRVLPPPTFHKTTGHYNNFLIFTYREEASQSHV